MFSGFMIDSVALDSLQIIYIFMKLQCPKIDTSRGLVQRMWSQTPTLSLMIGVRSGVEH